MTEEEFYGRKPIPKLADLTNSLKPTNPKDAVGIAKVPMSCVPSQPIMEAGLAMFEGARKYGRHNYRAVGVCTSVYYDALQRHVQAFWEGQDLDPDSGLPHLAKAIATLIVLRDAFITGNVVDDRPPRTHNEKWMETLNAQAKALIDKYPIAEQPYVQKECPNARVPVEANRPSQPKDSGTGPNDRKDTGVGTGDNLQHVLPIGPGLDYRVFR